MDEAALARALQAGRLAGAALDVFEEEPLGGRQPVAAHGQRDPHAARGLLLLARGGPGAERCGEEIARVLLKERPINVVNPEVYAPGRVRRGR